MEGMEKYLVLLKIAITITEYVIPRTVSIKPGNPRNKRGCLSAINSIRVVITDEPWEIGFIHEVCSPVW